MKYKNGMLKALTALILSLLCLVSCGSSDKGSDANENKYQISGDVSTDLGYAVAFLKDGKSDYQIVRPDAYGADHIVVKAVQRLRESIEAQSGIKLELSTDWVKNAQELEGQEHAFEILVGNTNRKETESVKKTLRENDYAIQVMGNKLVILGGTEEKTAEAVDKFIQLYFSAKQESLVLNGGYRYQSRYAYPVTGMSISGRDITLFSIIYSEGYEQSARLLADRIRINTGFVLEVLPESTAASDCEILVGNNVRNLSLDLGGVDYAVRVKDGRLLVYGADADKCSYGVRELSSQYLEKETFDANLAENVKISGKTKEPSQQKILSLNLDLSGYGENSVPNRYPRLCELVGAQDPDILCLRELSCTTWYDLVTKGSGTDKALTDKYTFVGTGRNGEKGSYEVHVEGAYNAILFKTDKYTLKDSGTFWLSETPGTPSVGWDGRTRAICTWAVLTDKTQGIDFLVMNTMLDTYGKLTQENSVKLIKDFAQEKSLHAVLCAQTGTLAKDKAYKVLSETFTDCLNISENTFNNYGNAVSETGARDFIFVSSGSASVIESALIKDTVDGMYVSPYWALTTTVGLYK